MHMFVFVYVYGCLNISVIVFVFVYVCVSGYLFACAYRNVMTQSVLPARRFGLAFLGPLKPGRLRLSCASRTPCPVLPARLASPTRTRTTPSPPSSMLRLVHVLFWWCVAVLVCLLLMLVCMCVVLRVMRAAKFRRVLDVVWQTSATRVGSQLARYSDASQLISVDRVRIQSFKKCWKMYSNF